MSDTREPDHPEKQDQTGEFEADVKTPEHNVPVESPERVAEPDADHEDIAGREGQHVRAGAEVAEGHGTAQSSGG